MMPRAGHLLVILLSIAVTPACSASLDDPTAPPADQGGDLPIGATSEAEFTSVSCDKLKWSLPAPAKDLKKADCYDKDLTGAETINPPGPAPLTDKSSICLGNAEDQDAYMKKNKGSCQRLQVTKPPGWKPETNAKFLWCIDNDAYGKNVMTTDIQTAALDPNKPRVVFQEACWALKYGKKGGTLQKTFNVPSGVKQ